MVVAIIAVLAAVVVPNFIRESARGKYDPEVRAMFTEIGVKEEQYKSELGNGLYLPATQCTTSPTPTGYDFGATCITSGSPWETLRIISTDATIRCTYEIDVGPGGSVPTMPTGFTGPPATFIAPWYYVLATCDMDGQGGTYSTFLSASWDTSVQKYNYGS